MTYEFTHINDRFRDRDFLLPELQLPSEQSPISTVPTHPSTLNRALTTGNAPTPHLLHPIGTPASSMNPLTPASVGPGSQSQQQAPSPSPSQSLFSPNPNFIGTGSPITTTTATNMPSSQLPAPSPMGTMTASPGDMCGTLRLNSVERKHSLFLVRHHVHESCLSTIRLDLSGFICRSITRYTSHEYGHFCTDSIQCSIR